MSESKLMIRQFLCLLFIISISSCTKKYYAGNSLGEDDINVTALIEDEGYKPLVCGNGETISALINPKPPVVNKLYEGQLKKGLLAWARENDKKIDSMTLSKISLISHSIYQYSYFITWDLVDVYKTEITIEDIDFKGFFRIEKKDGLFKDEEKLILPYDSDGWMHCSDE